jgi:hypothetical protein
MANISSSAALGVVGSILAGLDKAYTGFSDVVDAFTQGASTAKTQLTELTNFDFDPRFKTRVISVPLAVTAAEDLWDTIKSGLLEKFRAIIDDTEGLVDNLRNLPPKVPGEPILQRTALILSIIHATNEEIASLVTQVLDMTQIIVDIKHQIETLDAFFLSQSKPRVRGDFRYSKREA